MSAAQSTAGSAVLAHMRSHKRRWRNSHLARDLAMLPDDMRQLLDALIASGDIPVCIERERWYTLTDQAKRFVKPAPAAVTPPPYVNIWTRPLRYNMRAHADLAMAARSA